MVKIVSTADDIDASCNECQCKDYSPFSEPCVSCGFDCHNFKPREMDKVNNMSELKKPPLGLEPRWVHDSRRVKAILDAIERYTDANMSIPKKWVEELKDLFNAYAEK